MLLYVSRNFTATVTGKQLKTVHCEKCATEFHYELSRTATGQSSAPYYLGQDGAKKRAEKRAQTQLTKRLARELEMIPCPQCKWIDAESIARFRKSRFQGTLTFGIVLSMFGFIIALILYLTYENTFQRPRQGFPKEVAITCGIASGVLIFFWLVQWLLRRGIDPNRSKDKNGNPRVPLGTPPALLKRTALDGIAVMEAIPSELSNQQEEVTWATFRVGQLALVPMCVECLDVPTTVYKMPLVSERKLAVPMCATCLSKLRGRWWKCNLISALIAFGLVRILMMLPDRMDEFGRWAVSIVGGGFLTAIVFIILERRLQPYRIQSVDKSRGVWRIKFRNVAYTALMIRRIGEADGVFQKNA